MPNVTIQMFEGRSIDVKRNMCKRIAEVIAEETGLKPESVNIVIEEMKKENYFSSGKLFSDPE